MKKISNEIFICLIRLFTNNEKILRRRRIRDIIFNFCYQDFDKTIRSTLQYHNVPYGANYSYYNSVFFDVYDRVFKIEKFDKKIRKFDSQRFFLPWLKTVIRNEVRDWLKSLDPDSGLNKKIVLRKKSEIDSTIDTNNCLDNDKSYKNSVHPLLTNFIMGLDPFGGVKSSKSQKCLEESIGFLNIAQQTIIYFDMIAYHFFPQHIVAYISDQTQKTIDKVEADLDVLRQMLRASDKYFENKKKIRRLYTLYLEIELNEKKLHFLRKELEGLGFEDINTLELQAQSYKYKEDVNQLVKQKKNDYHQVLKSSCWDKNSAFINLKKSFFIKTLVYYRENIEARNKIISAFEKGALFIKPRSKQIAAILQISKGAVDTRRSRTEKVLREKYDDCMQR